VIVSTGTEAYNLLRQLEQRDGPVGIDCESEGIDPRVEPAAGPAGRIVCWTVSWNAATYSEDAFIWANPETWGILGPALASLPVVGHNIFGFDRHMFRKAGAPLGNIVADTMRMFKLINPSEEASASLKSLMKYWLNIEPVGGFMELFTRQKCLEQVPEGEYLRRKRKVGEEGGVPTLVGGAHSRVGSMTEVIPLSSLATDYPDLLPVLYKYAKLDSRATLDLYRLFDAKLKEMPWQAPLTEQTSTAGGTGRAKSPPTWRQPAATSM